MPSLRLSDLSLNQLATRNGCLVSYYCLQLIHHITFSHTSSVESIVNSIAPIALHRCEEKLRIFPSGPFSPYVKWKVIAVAFLRLTSLWSASHYTIYDVRFTHSHNFLETMYVCISLLNHFRCAIWTVIMVNTRKT